MISLLKILRFFVVWLCLQSMVTSLGFFLFDVLGAIVFWILFNLGLFLTLILAPHLLMGQIRGKMASSSTHLEDFLTLEVISRQCGVCPPAFYIYNSNQINTYLVKGPFSTSALAISSQCFLSLKLEERAELYRYQIMRLQFPFHLYIDTSVSVLLLFSTWLIELLFWPINMIGKKFFSKKNNHFQQVLKLICLPLFNLSKNIVLGNKKHSYLQSILTKTVSKEKFVSVYYKARQSLWEKGLEYDFLSCNGFMGFENDLFSALTETQEFKNYIWLRD